MPFGTPNGIKTAFPQIEDAAPFFNSDNDRFVIENNNTVINKFKEENGVFYAQSSFFKIFDFPLLAGTYAGIDEPNNVLLSEQTANKYFGDWRNAVGRTIRMNNDVILKVTGASLPYYEYEHKTFKIGERLFKFKGDVCEPEKVINKRQLIKNVSIEFIKHALPMGGRAFSGIDCSGFVQVIV